MADFEPKIAAFVCNWCTYAGADLTGTSRIKYAPNVRMIRLPCTGRIDFMLLLQALGKGMDGVIVSGCHPGDCHYTSGNFHARRRWMMFRRLLEFLGVDVRRIHFAWVSAAEGAKWAELVNSVVEDVRKLGPYVEFPRRLMDGPAGAGPQMAPSPETVAPVFNRCDAQVTDLCHGNSATPPPIPRPSVEVGR